jgi:hypothetical protein
VEEKRLRNKEGSTNEWMVKKERRSDHEKTLLVA